MINSYLTTNNNNKKILIYGIDDNELLNKLIKFYSMNNEIKNNAKHMKFENESDLNSYCFAKKIIKTKTSIKEYNLIIKNYFKLNEINN